MDRPSDKYYTELDDVLRNLAITEWDAFVKLVGEEAILAAKICVLRSRGKSLGQIASKFSETKRKVQWADERKCRCD